PAGGCVPDAEVAVGVGRDEDALTRGEGVGSYLRRVVAERAGQGLGVSAQFPLLQLLLLGRERSSGAGVAAEDGTAGESASRLLLAGEQVVLFDLLDIAKSDQGEHGLGVGEDEGVAGRWLSPAEAVWAGRVAGVDGEAVALAGGVEHLPGEVAQFGRAALRV